MAEPRLNNDRRPRRIVAEPSIRRPPVAVAASPVDTYVRPPESNVGRLAEALAEIQPSVGRFSETLANRAIEESLAEGRAAAERMAIEGKTLKEAMEQGLIAAPNNPWYMAAFDEHAGRAEAMKAAAEFRKRRTEDPNLTNAEDLGAFEKAQAEFAKGWLEELGEKSERFALAFNSYWNSDIATRQRPEFTKDLTERLERKFSGATRAQTINILTEDIPDAPLEEQALTLSILRQSMLDAGRPPENIDTDILEGIKEAAFIRGDFRVFNLVKHLDSAAQPTKLGNTDLGSKFIRAAKLELSEEMTRRRKEEERLAKERREQLKTEASKELYAILSTNINGDYKPIIDKLFKEDPTAAMEFSKMAKSFVNNFDALSRGDDQLYDTFRWRIRDPNNRLTQDEIDHAVATNQLTIEQGRDLTERRDNYLWKIRNRNKDDKYQNDLLRNSNFREVLSFVDKAIELDGKTTGYWERIKVYNEVADAFEAAVERRELDPNSTPDVFKWVREHADPIVQGRLNVRRETSGTKVRPVARDPRSIDNKSTTSKPSGSGASKPASFKRPTDSETRAKHRAKLDELKKKHNGNREAYLSEFREWLAEGN